MLRPLRALRAYRRFNRYRQVTVVLVKYGFEDIVDRLGAGTLGWRSARKRASSEEIPSPQRLSLALAELGPTFVKFGQLLSTRPDILPQKYLVELERLQDEVPPFPAAEARKMIREDLGKDPGELFASFDDEPVASASIAQVHRASLEDGTSLAVKIQRPGIHRLIETDLEILADLTQMIEQRIPELRWLRPQELVSQFARTIRRELDFVAEAQTMERFHRNFADDPRRFIPRVHWDYTTARVLTADFVEGFKVADPGRLEQLGFDCRTIAHNGATSILKEVFEYRLFHADPHPGNVFVLEGNVIATVDFGIVGRLDEETASHLATLLSSVLEKDVEGILTCFESMGLLSPSVETQVLELDLMEFLDRYHGLPLEALDLETIIQDLLGIVRRHQIILPVNLALLARMLVISAGVGRRLDPDFDLIAEARPFVRDFVLRQASPGRKIRSLARTLRAYQSTLEALPGNVDDILAKLKQGQMLVSIHHEGLSRFILEMDRSSNRVAFALIVASLIVGSSLVMQIERQPTVFGFPVLGLAGYLVAGVLGLWLVIAILRSGRI